MFIFVFMEVKDRKKTKIIQRNKKIRQRFQHLVNVQHFNLDHALDVLESEWLPLERSTIKLIITNTGYYKDL